MRQPLFFSLVAGALTLSVAALAQPGERAAGQSVGDRALRRLSSSSSAIPLTVSISPKL